MSGASGRIKAIRVSRNYLFREENNYFKMLARVVVTKLFGYRKTAGGHGIKCLNNNAALLSLYFSLFLSLSLYFSFYFSLSLLFSLFLFLPLESDIVLIADLTLCLCCYLSLSLSFSLSFSSCFSIVCSSFD
jgi:hypothetical protein